MRLIALFIGISAMSFAQDASEVLKKITSNYSDAEHLEYYTTYELLRGNSEVATSNYSGYVYKDGKQLYQKINQTEFIYASGFSLKINADQKGMELSNSQTAVVAGFDLNQTLKYVKKKSVKEVNGSLIVNLELMNADLGINNIQITANPKNYRISQLDIFYTALQDFSKNRQQQELDVARLRIKLYNYSTHSKQTNSVFNLSNYLVQESGVLVPVAHFQGYTITDNRN